MRRLSAQLRDKLWSPLLSTEPYRALEGALRTGRERETSVRVEGLVEASRALALLLAAARGGRRLAIVVPDDTALEAWRRDLTALAPLVGSDAARVVTLPALAADPYDDIAPHPEVARERVVALGALLRGEFDAAVLPVRTLASWLQEPEQWSRHARVVRTGDDLPPDRFVMQAMGMGYKRVDTVSAPGEVSRRGGIVDIFSPGADGPARIELFGDDVDSLRAFDTDHQRSTGTLTRVVIEPAAENPPTDEALGRLRRWLERDVQDEVDGVNPRHLHRRLEQLKNEGYWPGMEALAALTADPPATTLDYLGDVALVVDEPERTDDELIKADHEQRVSYEESGNRMLPPPARLYRTVDEIRGDLAGAALTLTELIGAGAGIVFHTRGAPSYGGRLQDLAAAVKAAAGRRTVCLMRAKGGAERLQEVLGEYELPVTRLETLTDEDPDDGGVLVGISALRAGFEFGALTVLGQREVFGERQRKVASGPRSRAAFISDFRDLKIGDMVVHVDHGIARFAGLGRPKGGSLNRDFMTLEFAGRDKLFVPVDRLDLVQKYRGVAGGKPKLDRLGGPGWQRVKNRVRKSVENMARQLLELYARRKSAGGHAFGADTDWQKEFEEGFAYELTADQQRALADIKADMEAPRAMDRLLVGDVGFGKTEVAARAAFKAVMDGKQVALLAPTTVLAVQHERTFRDRFAPFPVRVDMISRFRGAAEIRRSLEDTAAGEVDILIGTHRLLSKDVRFKDLGLLIVDEEQRFGVAHKERLKQLSVGVDALATTATPIPRTLQMSLAGVRDLSIIESPPPGRLAIQTTITPFRKNVLAQAMRQELRRDGQVFVVHNRVETLPALTRAVQEMVPEARVVMGHGQMRERELEEVMLRFVGHEADILVTTTIIENGLDISRANTIIVNRADRFGLSQLYQLRGRVGRSRDHAYAYFVVPGRNLLSEVARKRLRALQEFSDLGAGFRLAAADLEIRGAGEFLGTRQHGHIAALGFDMYCQMLERAVGDLSGETRVTTPPPTLHLGLDIKVPENYMPESGDRLALYKRLAGAHELTRVDDIESDTEDRYGMLPPAARNLFDLTRVRLVAQDAGVKSVDIVEGRLQVRFHAEAAVNAEAVLDLVRSREGRLTPTGMLIVPAPADPKSRLSDVRGIVAGLS